MYTVGVLVVVPIPLLRMRHVEEETFHPVECFIQRATTRKGALAVEKGEGGRNPGKDDEKKGGTFIRSSMT